MREWCVARGENRFNESGMRRVLPVAVFVALVAIAWFAWPRAKISFPAGGHAGVEAVGGLNAPPPVDAAPGAATARGPVKTPAAPPAPAFNADDFPIVAPLNQPTSTIARDLDTVSQLLDAWRTNFPRLGNPVGENSDITAALAGDNALGLMLIPRTHPAINARGELCDRWGTPFRFHQLSGERMEIRSAGPDGKFATADDAVWNPAP